MNEILKFDEFAWDAPEVRAAVISGEFGAHVGPDGATYTGISLYPVPHWVDRIAELLKHKIVPRLSCFRLNLKGENPHSWVHSDDICARYASVLYLNEPDQCFGGTAFWKHKTLGINYLPSEKELEHHGVVPAKFYANMNEDWKKKDLWKMERFVGMQWNRFITYRTSLFHSRYPFEAFGSGPRDGRLIWICFYDLAETVE